ncbi:MAG TPA: hypothetical protein VMR70_01170 [Flavisolibacter sp.]|nr:hypothetical protein [Flavisolibacter sp.]
MALFEYWNQNGFQSPIPITRQKLMAISKINGLATYHKCIRDLNEFGYIKYEPSKNPAVNSVVSLLV